MLKEILILLTLQLLQPLNANGQSHDKVVACYIASWAAYRPMNGSFTANDIDPQLCTHIIYTFAGLNNETFTIHSMDPYLDTEDFGGRAQYKKIISFKQQQPKLKVTVAIGGWNEGSGKYSNMSATKETRKTFIDSVITFLKKYNFDGLDLDWEYPGSRLGHRVEDRENFALLIKEMRTEFNKFNFLLTAAIGAAPSTINRGYDVPSISENLDYIHIMSYDYGGSWDGMTGHNAPLRLPSNISTTPELRLSVEDTVQYLISKGAPRQKLVLGLPFYGRTFILQDTNLAHKGAMTQGSGFQGPYTREDGFLGYNEICKELRSNSEEKWTEEWDDVAKVPYMVKGNRWVSYDNERSIAIKTRFALTEKLAGVMIWAMDNDDFAAECSKIKYPLLRTINSELKEATDHGDIPPIKPDDGDQKGHASIVQFNVHFGILTSVIILFLK